MASTGTLFNLLGIFTMKTKDGEAKLDIVDKKAKKTSKSIDKVSTSTNSSSKSMGGFSSALGKGAMKLGAVAAAAGVAFKALMEFNTVNKEQAQLGTLFVGNAEKSNKLAQEMKKIAANLGIDEVKALGAAYKVVSTQLGTTVEDYKKAAEVGLKLARVGKAVGDSLDTSAVINLLSTEIRAFGMSTKDVSKVADKLFKTIQLGNTDINQLASALPQVSAVAAGAGVKFEELLSIVAGASKIIPDNIQITNSLTTSIAQLQNGTAGVGKKFNKIFGTDFKTAMKQTGSFTNLMVEFDKRLKASGSSIAEAFGVRGLKGIAAIVQSAPDINKSMAEISNSVGLVDAGMKGLAKQGALSFDQLMVKFKQIIAEIGQSLFPIIKIVTTLINKITPIITQISKLLSKILKPIFDILVPIIDLISEVLGIVMEALTPVTDLLSTLSTILLKVLEPILKIIMNMFKALAPILKVALVPLKILTWLLKLMSPILDLLLIPLNLLALAFEKIGWLTAWLRKPLEWLTWVLNKVMEGIHYVVRGIAKAIDMATKIATLGFGGTNFTAKVDDNFAQKIDLNSTFEDIEKDKKEQKSKSKIGSMQSSKKTQTVNQTFNFPQQKSTASEVARQTKKQTQKALSGIINL